MHKQILSIYNRKGLLTTVMAKGKKKNGSASKITTLVSRGGISKTHFSGNCFKTLDIEGSPWDGSQDGAFGHDAYHLRLNNYFSDEVFASFDYFRVKGCKTTISWKTSPVDTGMIMGEYFWYNDHDSLDSPIQSDIANRRDLKNGTFSNERRVHHLKWQPYVVQKETDPVDYVQPVDRWMNTTEVSKLRWGSIILMFTTDNRNAQYPNGNPNVSIRHEVTCEFKGQRSVQVQ